MISLGILRLTVMGVYCPSQRKPRQFAALQKAPQHFVPTGRPSWDQGEWDGQGATHVAEQQVAVPAAKPVFDSPGSAGVYFPAKVPFCRLRPLMSCSQPTLVWILLITRFPQCWSW